MKVVISHKTAARFWIDPPVHPSMLDNPDSLTFANEPYAHTGSEVEELLSRTGFEWSAPLDMLVPNKSLAHSSGSLRFHIHEGKMPKGALLKLSEGVYIASPELAFLQMAALMPYVEAVRLGYRYCGRYTLRSGENKKAVPLCSEATLCALLDSMSGRNGVKIARSVLKQVHGHTASPKETELAMLMHLPKKLGGYAIPVGEINAEIPLSEHDARIVGKDHFECDELWEFGSTFKMTQAQRVRASKFGAGKGLATEYDSEEHHSDSNENLEDSIKRTTLGKMGFKVVTIRHGQLANPALFDIAMRDIASSLGMRIREPFAPKESDVNALRAFLSSKVEFPSLS